MTLFRLRKTKKIHEYVTVEATDAGAAVMKASTGQAVPAGMAQESSDTWEVVEEGGEPNEQDPTKDEKNPED